ncbi:hypothetical protein GH714_015894 [Hevea brasiliensis]|uniref:Uncharacterized protein n=1 Tax=Hevea brasiliensis TaxID=3981 RepID=A0A6A6M0B2_HEVBR|nr:hypothetical protein GH714_015894 [Hevea brasiliensis]
MGFSSLGVKKSSKQQQNSKIVKDMVLLTQATQSIKHQDKLKAESYINKPYDDLPHELRKHTNARAMVQQKTTVNSQQLSVIVRATKDDELVKLNYEIPHSCPLSPRVEINIEQQEMAPDAINTQDAELSSDAINTIKSSNEILVETSKIFNQDTEEVAARKGRHPSPNRRFSFSLGQMTRSFSFKESSAVPRLTSTHVSVKSGPVLSKASAGLDDSNREKASCHRSKSSPLRRLLDPLLKSKGLTPNPSAQTDQLFRGSLNSYSFKPINTESHQKKSVRHQA